MDLRVHVTDGVAGSIFRLDGGDCERTVVAVVAVRRREERSEKCILVLSVEAGRCVDEMSRWVGL